MRKALVVMMLLFMFGFSSTFAIGNIGIFVDYTTVSMTKVNEQVDVMATNVTIPPYAPEVTKFGSGLIFGATAGVSVIPMLEIGIRAGYLYAFPATIKLDVSLLGYYMKTTFNFDASLIPIQGGLSFKFAPPLSPLFFGVGAYAGYGIANAKVTAKTETNFPGYTIPAPLEIPLEGGCPVFDILANAGISIGPAISLALELGYRIANVSEMKLAQNVNNPDYGIISNKGEVVKDPYGKVVPFDFSGLVAGLKFNIGF